MCSFTNTRNNVKCPKAEVCRSQ